MVQCPFSLSFLSLSLSLGPTRHNSPVLSPLCSPLLNFFVSPRVFTSVFLRGNYSSSADQPSLVSLRFPPNPPSVYLSFFFSPLHLSPSLPLCLVTWRQCGLSWNTSFFFWQTSPAVRGNKRTTGVQAGGPAEANNGSLRLVTVRVAES